MIKCLLFLAVFVAASHASECDCICVNCPPPGCDPSTKQFPVPSCSDCVQSFCQAKWKQCIPGPRGGTSSSRCQEAPTPAPDYCAAGTCDAFEEICPSSFDSTFECSEVDGKINSGRCHGQSFKCDSSAAGGNTGAPTGLVVFGVGAAVCVGAAVAYFLYQRRQRSSATLLDGNADADDRYI